MSVKGDAGAALQVVYDLTSGNVTESVHREALEARLAWDAQRLGDALAELQQEGLVVAPTGSDYQLTSEGVSEAERAAGQHTPPTSTTYIFDHATIVGSPIGSPDAGAKMGDVSVPAAQPGPGGNPATTKPPPGRGCNITLTIGVATVASVLVLVVMQRGGRLDPSGPSRASECALLAKHALTTPSPELTRRFAALRSERDPSLRVAQINSMGKLRDPRAVERLGRSLRDSNPEVRRAAIDAMTWTSLKPDMARIPAAGVPPERRPEVTSCIQALTARKTSDTLVQFLQDGDSTVRVKAAQALGRIGSEAAVAPLEQAAESKDRNLQEAARTALQGVRERLPRAAPEQAPEEPTKTPTKLPGPEVTPQSRPGVPAPEQSTKTPTTPPGPEVAPQSRPRVPADPQ